MLQEMPGEPVLLRSNDTIIEELADVENYPVEFLHTVETSGLPPHILHLKVGCVLIVLRNFAPHQGVCNGTRMLLEKIGQRLLHVRILSGPKRGTPILLPRICCDSTCDGDIPFAFRRYQYPVKLAWAITINKSQGQPFKSRLGVYLPRTVFAHGQL